MEGELFASLLDSTGPLSAGISAERLRQLQERLGLLAQFLDELQLANRTMARRAHVEAGFPEAVREELARRTAELDQQLTGTRDQLRSTFGVLAELASFQQLAVSQTSSRQAKRFQTATAVVASVVVGPSLVAAFYGGDISGLPQNDVEREFALVLALSVAMSALVFLLVMCCVLLPSIARRRSSAGPLRDARRTPVVPRQPGRGPEVASPQASLLPQQR